MRIHLEQPALLSKAIDIISDLVTEVRLKLTDYGLSITAIDPANVALLQFKLPKSAFSSYEVTKDDVLGVNLDDLKRILKRCGPKSSVLFEHQENTLTITIQDAIRREFRLGLIEVEGEDKSMPPLEFASNVTVPSQDIALAIEDCAVVSDSCLFEVKENSFSLAAKNMNAATMTFSGDVATISGEPCSSRYSLEYLGKFMKASKLVPKTILRLATNHPMRLDFLDEHFELSFLLAPRVDRE